MNTIEVTVRAAAAFARRLAYFDPPGARAIHALLALAEEQAATIADLRVYVEAAETQKECERQRADRAEATLARVRAIAARPAPQGQVAGHREGYWHAQHDLNAALNGRDGRS